MGVSIVSYKLMLIKIMQLTYISFFVMLLDSIAFSMPIAVFGRGQYLRRKIFLALAKGDLLIKFV